MKVFFNADVGEGAGFDDEIIPLVHGANISCGAHAGSREDIRKAIACAVDSGCRIGAHPGYPDRDNFGRIEVGMNPEELHQTLHQQLSYLHEFVEHQGGELTYIKPHGALYNRMAKDREFAEIVLDILADWKPLPVMMLAGSVGRKVALEQGREVIAEGFLDRGYTDSGLLVPRGEPDAVLTDISWVKRQARAMLAGRPFPSATGNMIDVKVGSICVHGDTPAAVGLLKTVLEDQE